MLENNKKEIMVAGLFTALFLLGGFIHVLMGPWDFTSCVAQIYYSSLVLIWAVTIQYRIVNKRVRRLLLATVGLFMLAFFLQMCRYRIFDGFPTARRFFWYGYYIPVVLVPLLFLFVVLHLHLQEHEAPNRRWFFMLLPAAGFLSLVMTNDLHHQIFLFTKGFEGTSGTYTHGPLFYGIYLWVIGVLILSIYLAMKQCRIPGIGRKLWMPAYFGIFGILIVLSMFDVPKIADVTVWLFIECLAMMIIGIEESCIQLGLIPANSNYRTIAKLANKPVIISDEKGTSVYASESAREMFLNRETVEIHTKPIKGGNVTWAVDMAERIALNGEIEKAIDEIETRNEYLRNENALKEKQAGIAARNTLYNQIAEIVRPQLETIEELLKNPEAEGHLAKIAFLNAYIKRRSNMELLKSDHKPFPTEELASAIRESCRYLELCDVRAMLHIMPKEELSAETQLFLYEAFEIVAESCLDTLQFLLVNIIMENGQPALRMTVKAPGWNMDFLPERISRKGGTIRSVTEDDADERIIIVTCREGGGAL